MRDRVRRAELELLAAALGRRKTHGKGAAGAAKEPIRTDLIVPVAHRRTAGRPGSADLSEALAHAPQALLDPVGNYGPVAEQEPGRLADVVVFAQNPLDRIGNLGRPRMVFKKGTLTIDRR